MEGYKPTLVRNAGAIFLTKPGGIVALLGGAVQTSGTIMAKTGSVGLGAGEQITLTFDQAGSFGIAVDQPLSEVAVDFEGNPVSSAILQSGLISGAYVLVKANALPGLFNRLISLPSGVIEAVGVINRNGRIELIGQGGELYSNGTLRANGNSENVNGGEILIWATKVVMGAGSRVTANAAEGGKAGSVSLIGDQKVVLSHGSRIEAKASGRDGQGGSVRVTSSRPKVDGEVVFENGAVIDVSGGSSSGDAGDVELSAAEVGFGGNLVAQAQTGFTGGSLLVDPLNKIGRAHF